MKKLLMMILITSSIFACPSCVKQITKKSPATTQVHAPTNPGCTCHCTGRWDANGITCLECKCKHIGQFTPVPQATQSTHSAN